MASGVGVVHEKGIASPGYRLPATAHVGRVRLAVSQLERSVAFYRDVIGLAVLERAGNLARLGAGGQVLLELEALPGVRSLGRSKRLGLYHTAFLLPSRADLSAFVRHLWKLGVGFGAGDHLVSEALYLVDPDDLEVEVYADRPREAWTYKGQMLRMGTDAVRFDELAAVATGEWQGAPAGTTTGHMHFYVGDLAAAAEFYLAGLGLDVTVQIPSALFTSAGGYHHHVGLNVWAAGSPVASERDARLLFWELVLPDAEEVAKVAGNLVRAGYSEAQVANGARAFTDPWGITAALVAGANQSE
jgi:catechol 2,3-dioxygenase